MRVLVVGSVYDPQGRGPFEDACRQLGRAFANARFEIIVGSNELHTADHYILEGAADVGARPKLKVHVYRPSSKDGLDATTFMKQWEPHQRHFDLTYRQLEGPWAAGRATQILAADVVVLIGGGRGTLQVGYQAPILHRPVLAIGCFGGAAKELWEHLRRDYQALGERLVGQISTLNGLWDNSGSAVLVVTVMTELVHRRVAREDRPYDMVALLVATLVLLGLWVATFSHLLGTNGLAFFALLWISTLLGVSLRTALRATSDQALAVSTARLAGDIIAALVLAFGLALMFLVGGLTITGSTEFIDSLSKSPDFARVGLVMSAIGLLSGFAIETASDRLRQLLMDFVGATARRE